MTNWWDYMCAFIKGPGWFPGTERLGDPTFVEERPVRDKYGPSVNPLLHVYTLAHFVFVIGQSDLLARAFAGMEQWTSLLIILYLLGTMTSIGILYDKSSLRWLLELARCGISLLFLETLVTVNSVSVDTLNYVYTGSAAISVVGLIMDMASSKKEKVN